MGNKTNKHMKEKILEFLRSDWDIRLAQISVGLSGILLLLTLSGIINITILQALIPILIVMSIYIFYILSAFVILIWEIIKY